VRRARREAGQSKPAPNGSWPPFEPGHTLSLKHGAYSELEIRPRVQELRAALLEQLPSVVASQRFAATLDVGALCLTRLERAAGAVIDADETDERIEVLDRRAARWAKLALAALAELGATPRSAAALGLDVSRIEAELSRAEALEQGRRVRLAAEARLGAVGAGVVIDADDDGDGE
jgi:hypothetical protein